MLDVQLCMFGTLAGLEGLDEILDGAEIQKL
jgi:hypothetical protein